MAQDQTPQLDSKLILLYSGVAIVVGFLLLWYFCHTYITEAVFMLRRGEIFLITTVFDFCNTLLSLLHIPSIPTDKLHEWITYLDAMKGRASEVDIRTIGLISWDVGLYLCGPCALAIVGLSCFLCLSPRIREFTRSYNMKLFRRIENKNWPQITPIIQLDLVNEDIDKGPWAMARTPIQFCQAHNMIYTAKENDNIVWKVDTAAAVRVLNLQMGPRWQGVDALPIHVKALVVVFIACAHRQREVANDLLAQIGRSAVSSGALDFSRVEELLRRYKKSSLIKRVEQYHGYVLTVMATLIKMARTDGVVACADFLWLKPLDRRLWFMLNSVGRQTCFTEVAGPVAHWLAEKKVGRALRTPMIKQAVTAFEVAMADTLYIPEGEEWRPDAV